NENHVALRGNAPADAAKGEVKLKSSFEVVRQGEAATIIGTNGIGTCRRDEIRAVGKVSVRIKLVLPAGNLACAVGAETRSIHNWCARASSAPDLNTD